jgi:hypothetical protein
MTRHVLLNNVEHKNLKVKREYSRALGNDAASVLTFPTEFGDVHKEYPILFQKNPETGRYYSLVLLGFEKGENLFLTESEESNYGWKAKYVPGMMARGPFLIGLQDQVGNSVAEPEAMVYVDLDSPRLSYDEGESLFKEFGGNSPYLENISSILRGIHEGMKFSEVMFSIFEKYDLIEPITINIQLNNGQKYTVTGNYTINQQKLAELNGDALEQLNKSGFLQGAFLVVSSLGNIQKLIDIKNARL